MFKKQTPKLRKRGIQNAGTCRHVRVAYLTGPLFFAATSNFNEVLPGSPLLPNEKPAIARPQLVAI